MTEFQYEEPFLRTLAVHAGREKGKHFPALSVPIYTASIFAFDDADDGIAIHNYARLATSTDASGLPHRMPSSKPRPGWKGGESALAFASGHGRNIGHVSDLP